ncbi:hypothetical protein ACFFSH_34355 [Streptomyces filamentosus]|uniref:Secreted protein n=1 Tax=Streptomyces filamentosus TaxID=67294 RepID=A0A919EPA4_STRFL|nr:hypothetical protein [Streptomyces filamentosus]GHG04723.1 hypothetical protein GCM10017667_39110 [Streptomyces filamentosus]
MKRFRTRTTAAAVTALLLAAAAPASAATYTHDRQNACRQVKEKDGCRPGIVVKHWHKGRSTARGVGWVYASMETRGRAAKARWLYQRPGGRMTAATGWKTATRPGSETSFVETSWGRDGRTGPQYPVGTKICVQFRDLGQPLCVRLR